MKIAEVHVVVGATETYVEKTRTEIEPVKVEIEPVKVVEPWDVLEERWDVLEERWIEEKFGDMHLIQIRKYKTGGKYQEWHDGKYSKTIPEDE